MGCLCQLLSFLLQKLSGIYDTRIDYKICKLDIDLIRLYVKSCWWKLACCVLPVVIKQMICLHYCSLSINQSIMQLMMRHMSVLKKESQGTDTVCDLVIPSASQVMAVQPIVSRSRHLISHLDCQTALCNTFNLEVAMLHRDLWLIDMIDWGREWKFVEIRFEAAFKNR